MSPSVSAYHDLRPSVPAVRTLVHVHYSNCDWWWMGVVTGVVGTTDREWGRRRPAGDFTLTIPPWPPRSANAPGNPGTARMTTTAATTASTATNSWPPRLKLSAVKRPACVLKYAVRDRRKLNGANLGGEAAALELPQVRWMPEAIVAWPGKSHRPG